jgi:hypothetical protein
MKWDVKGARIDRPRFSPAGKKTDTIQTRPIDLRKRTMNQKDEKGGSGTNRGEEQVAADELQKQIDALVRGEIPQGSRTLRDLTSGPAPSPEIRKYNSLSATTSTSKAPRVFI